MPKSHHKQSAAPDRKLRKRLSYKANADYFLHKEIGSTLKGQQLMRGEDQEGRRNNNLQKLLSIY